jgi:hypothetical protein
MDSEDKSQRETAGSILHTLTLEIHNPLPFGPGVSEESHTQTTFPHVEYARLPHHSANLPG